MKHLFSAILNWFAFMLFGQKPEPPKPLPDVPTMSYSFKVTKNSKHRPFSRSMA